MNVVSKDNLTKQIKDKIFNEELIPQADALYNFAYSLVFEEARAQDLVQEAYLKAYRFIHSFEPGSNAKAWLFQILKNAFINEYRKKSRQPQKVDFEDFNSKNQLEKQSVSIDIGQDIYAHMLGDEITGALNKLPVDFRVAIILSDLEGFTYEEIANYLSFNQETLDLAYHHYLKYLYSQLYFLYHFHVELRFCI